MKTIWIALRLRLQCWFLRTKYRKELLYLVFNEYRSTLGEVITGDNGVQLMIVGHGHREANSWVSPAYIIHVPEPVIPPIPLDFLSDDLSVGTSIVMGGNLWVKEEAGYVLQSETIRAQA